MTSVATPRTPIDRFDGGRLVFLDALRGIAALAVAWFHFYRLTPLYHTLDPVVPAPLETALKLGFVGVDIFFVLSGFVIAYSVREARITPRFLGRFALRRSIRLDPPYWITIAIAIALTAAWGWMTGTPADLPSVREVLAHMAYLQNILGYRNIVSVFWTLAYEVQFYLVLVILLGLAQLGARSANASVRRMTAPVLFVPLAVISLVLLATETMTWGWFIDWWYAFFLGAVTFWALAGRVRMAWWGVLFAATLAAALRNGDVQPFVVLATAAAILGVGLAGRLRSWLNVRPLQFLGRISYSVYLVHFLGATVIKLGMSRIGGSVAGALLLFVAANVVSILAAWLMYRLVEAPSLRLTKHPDPVAAVRGWVTTRWGKPVSGFAE